MSREKQKEPAQAARPNVILNLPMELRTFAAIAGACPEDAVMVKNDDGTQAHIYFNREDVPKKSTEGGQ